MVKVQFRRPSARSSKVNSAKHWPELCWTLFALHLLDYTGITIPDLDRLIINVKVRWECYPNVGNVKTPSAYHDQTKSPMDIARVGPKPNGEPVWLVMAMSMQCLLVKYQYVVSTGCERNTTQERIWCGHPWARWRHIFGVPWFGLVLLSWWLWQDFMDIRCSKSLRSLEYVY